MGLEANLRFRTVQYTKGLITTETIRPPGKKSYRKEKCIYEYGFRVHDSGPKCKDRSCIENSAQSGLQPFCRRWTFSAKHSGEFQGCSARREDSLHAYTQCQHEKQTGALGFVDETMKNEFFFFMFVCFFLGFSFTQRCVCVAKQYR